MTTLEKIKTEYMLYELEVTPGESTETDKILEKFIDDMDATISSSITAINENLRDEQITKVKNCFYGLFGYEEKEIEQIVCDNGVILRHRCLAERYKEYFSTMRDAVSDDNYVDMCKLAMFTYQSYTDNYRYLESLRDGIKFATEGITFYGSGEDTHEEYAEFFRDAIENASYIEGVEKVKK